MRFDNVGMFWQDVPVERKKGVVTRPMPPIPETGWRPPAYFPNLADAPVLSFDVETKDTELEDHGPGWARGQSHIVGFSVGAPGGYRWYFPIRHEVQSELNLNPEHALAWLKDTMARPMPKVGANLIYDVGSAANEGITINGDLIDVQFAEALLDEAAEVNLDALSLRYLGEGKTSNLLYKWCADYYGGGVNSKQRKNIYRAPPTLVGPYGEADADLPLRLAPVLHRKLVAERLDGLFKMECDLIRLYVAMRFAGVTVNIAKAEQLYEELGKRTELKQRELNQLAGTTVNVNAPETLKKAWNNVGLPHPKLKGKVSFKRELIEGIDHPLPQAVMEVRRTKKLKDTFIKSYILDGHVKGKLHCSFHPLRGDSGGTRSGRMSSSDPNLQNIPIRDPELGHLIRALFEHDVGHHKWRKYDYSQIEYRGLVHFAVGPGAEEARQMFRAKPKTDYHVYAQELVERIVQMKLERKPIKNLNFGVVYGMGEKKMQRSLHLKTAAEAQRLMAAYHQGVPFAKPTLKAAAEFASKLGYIETILGRRSRFDLWEPDEWGSGGEDDERAPALPYEEAIVAYRKVRRAFTHKALNRKLQGSAADLLKAALWFCWTQGIFGRTGIPRLLVHDELDFSDPGGVDKDFREMQHVLETALPFSIPIRADGEWGPDWGNLVEIPAGH